MDKQPNEMNALKFLIGKWNTTGEILAAVDSPVIKIKGTDSYEWILDGHFILHKIDVMMGNDRTNVIEIIGEFNNTSKSYKMRSFDSQGNFMTMEGHFDERGTLHILGNNMRSKLSMDDSNNMIAQWEKLDAGKNWLHWMDLKFSK